MKNVVIAMSLVLVSLPVLAAKPCDELKTEIAAKLDAKGVAGYTLEVVANDQVADQKVVGSCDGGTKKLVYARNASVKAPAAPSALSTQVQ